MPTILNDREIAIRGRAMRYVTAPLKYLRTASRLRRLTPNEKDELLSLIQLARRL